MFSKIFKANRCEMHCNSIHTIGFASQLSHTLWSQVIRKGDLVIDATCGNGFDSVVLSNMTLSVDSGRLYCLDIQAQAIKQTKEKLIRSNTNESVLNRVKLIQCNHEKFPLEIGVQTVSAIVYNLGYLPGTSLDGSDRLTTTAECTIQSFRSALPLLRHGGILTAIAYRGHEGGAKETEECIQFFAALDKTIWRVHSHSALNSQMAPILFSVYRL
jgi:hypothetical protein